MDFSESPAGRVCLSGNSRSARSSNSSPFVTEKHAALERWNVPRGRCRITNIERGKRFMIITIGNVRPAQSVPTVATEYSLLFDLKAHTSCLHQGWVDDDTLSQDPN